MIKFIPLLILVLLSGCKDDYQAETFAWAKESIEWEEKEEGKYLITFESPIFYGDIVQFDSILGDGIGIVDAITIGADGAIWFTVKKKGTEDYYGGIYADEIIRVIERAADSDPVDGDQ